MSRIKIIILLFFILLLCRDAAAVGKVIPLDELAEPFTLIVDRDRIYVSDAFTIKIFSHEDFVLLRTIGRQGEGPGEFMNNPHLYVKPGVLYVSSGKKLSIFNPSGQFLKEIKFNLRVNFITPVGESFAGFKLQLDPEAFFFTYVLFDAESRVIKEFHRGKWLVQPNRKRELFELLFFDVKDDKIVFTHYSDEFAIDILNAEAKLLHSIRRSDPRIPFTGKDRQAVLEYWKHHSQFKKQFDYYKEHTVFPQYYPALSACRTAGKKIYAVTHLRKQGKSECFVYDMDGKFQKRIFIPLWKEAPYEHPVFAIFDGHLFQIIDNLEEETWELHIHPIE